MTDHYFPAFNTPQNTTQAMSTFVLPLPGTDGSVSSAPKTYSLDNLDNLVDYINSSEILQESLEVDYSVGYGVWETIDKNYIVAADYSDLSWGDVLGRQHLDHYLRWESFRATWKPTEDEWMAMRKAIAGRLAMDINKATGRPVDSSRIRYTIRRKQSSGAKIFKVFFI